MAFQKKKIQIALTLLLTLGSAWAYHTAVVVQELTKQSEEHKPARKPESGDDELLQSLDVKCRLLIKEWTQADDDSSSEDSKNPKSLAQTGILNLITGFTTHDWLKIYGCINLSPEEQRIQTAIRIALTTYECECEPKRKKKIVLNLRNLFKSREFEEKERLEKIDDLFNILRTQRIMDIAGDQRLEATFDKKRDIATRILIELNHILSFEELVRERARARYRQFRREGLNIIGEESSSGEEESSSGESSSGEEEESSSGESSSGKIATDRPDQGKTTLPYEFEKTNVRSNEYRGKNKLKKDKKILNLPPKHGE